MFAGFAIVEWVVMSCGWLRNARRREHINEAVSQDLIRAVGGRSRKKKSTPQSDSGLMVVNR